MTTATNPTTGEKYEWDGNAWGPITSSLKKTATNPTTGQRYNWSGNDWEPTAGSLEVIGQGFSNVAPMIGASIGANIQSMGEADPVKDFAADAMRARDLDVDERSYAGEWDKFFAASRMSTSALEAAPGLVRSMIFGGDPAQKIARSFTRKPGYRIEQPGKRQEPLLPPSLQPENLGKSTADYWTERTKPLPQGAPWPATFAAEAVQGVIPSLAIGTGVGLATKNPVAGANAGAAAMYPYVAGLEYNQRRNVQGLPARQSREVARSMGAMEIGPERLVMGKFLEAGVGFLRRTLGGAASEAIQEGWTQLGQDLYTAGYVDPKLAVMEYLKRIGHAAAVGGIGGAAVGGAIGGAESLARRMDQTPVAQLEDQPVAKTRPGFPPIPPAEPQAPRPSPVDAAPSAPPLQQEPLSIQPDLTAPDRERSAPRAVLGGGDAAYSPRGEAVPIQYAVIEAGDLIASNDDAGNINPAYPAELQPRDRTRAASGAQVANIANNLNPQLLGPSPTITDGAPIIGDDMIVESGNARVIAIGRAYREGNDRDLRSYIIGQAETLGLDPAAITSMQAPVLVRIRRGGGDRAEFARQANERTTAAMSGAEQASTDAARISLDDLKTFAPDESGNVLAATNRPFISAFIQKLGPEQAAGLLDEQGGATRQLVDRVTSAVFARVYGDQALTSLQAEAADPDSRNILNALLQAAPAFARARALSDTYGDSGITNIISQSVKAVRQAKQSGQSIEEVIGQAQMFEPLDPSAGLLARYLAGNIRSAKRMAEGLIGIAGSLESNEVSRGQGQMFEGGEAQPLPEIIETATDEETPSQGSIPLPYAADRAKTAETGPGIALEALESIVNKVRGALAHGDIDIRIVETADQVRRDAPEELRGAYQPGQEPTIYLVRSQLADEQQAVRTILHELVGHYGAKVFLGSQFDSFMDEVYAAILAKPDARLKSIRERYGEDVSDRLIAEEYIASLAEDQPKHPWVDRLVVMLAQAIRKLAKAINVPIRMTRAEMTELVTEIRQFLRTGERQPMQEAEAGAGDLALGVRQDLASRDEGRGRWQDWPAHWPRTIADNDPLLEETINKPGRTELRQKIIEDILASGSRVQGRKPVAYIMGGGGASGKSTVLASWQRAGLVPRDSIVHIDPDDIKARIPEYDEIIAAKDSRAAAVVHAESSQIGGDAFMRATALGSDLILDTTMRNLKRGLRDMQALQDAGYKVIMIGVSTDVDLALRFAEQRAQETFRYVPLESIAAAHRQYAANWDTYVAKLDEAHLVENIFGTPAHLVTQKVDGGINVVDEVALRRFKQKGESTNADNQERSVGDGSYAADRGEQNKREEGGPAGEEAAIRYLIGQDDPATGGTLGDLYRKVADKAMDRVNAVFNPFHGLPNEDEYLEVRYKTLGKLQAAKEVGEHVRKALMYVAKDTAAQSFEFLTTAGADPHMITDLDARRESVAAKQKIHDISDALVERGLIPVESREKFRDRYLPRVYLKYLLDDDSYKAFAAGKKPGAMGWAKHRNEDIPEAVREVILGEIKNPGFLASAALSTPARDMALLDWLAQISETDGWALPQATVQWQGHSVTPYWMVKEAERLRKMARYMIEDRVVGEGTLAPYKPAEAARGLADKMEAEGQAAIDAITSHEIDLSDYKQTPDTPRYGRMRGLWVRNEIHNDIVGVNSMVPRDMNWVQSLLGYGGVGTKLTQIWKGMKVGLNPPGQIRNAVSNVILANLSGVSWRNMPRYLLQAAREIKKGGPHWDIVKEHGVMLGTFSAVEMHRMVDDLIELQHVEGGLNLLGEIKRLAMKGYNKAGDWYQLMEAVGKTTIIIDQKAKGKTDAEAVKKANDWLFDYSLVPPSVQVLRGLPYAAPFITFQYKVLPRLIETALYRPQAFAGYAAFFLGMPWLIAEALDVDEDDIKALMKALPTWLQERGHVMFVPYKDKHGRWSFVDIGYFMPWSMWTELIKDLYRLELGEASRTAGIISGPLLSAAIGIKMNEDPFTERQIVFDDDPPQKQLLDILTYVWSIGAPPFLTEYGAAGHLWRAYTGRVTRHGEPASTPFQAAMRFTGINVYPVEPERSRSENVRRLNRELNDLKGRMRQDIIHQGKPERQDAVIEDYIPAIERKAAKIEEYEESSRIHPNLR